MTEKILIGIDAGVNTGFARTKNGKLIEVLSMQACRAETEIELESGRLAGVGGTLEIYIEDARQRKWVTGGREKLQGVGSVKRDCQRWEEFCEYHGIDYELVAPKNNRTKTTASEFKRITGWKQRTNEHGRDAAMLIYGR